MTRPFRPNQELQEFGLTQPCLTRCAWCKWTHLGSVIEGREAHAKHRTRTHHHNARHRRWRRLPKTA